MAKGGGISKKLDTSEAMFDFSGKAKLSRGDAMKVIWAYIKKKDLQNPENKREILPDDKLGTILGTKPLSMFQIGGKLNDHLIG